MDFTEKTLKQKLVFQGKIIDVRQDSIMLPNGKTATRDMVVHTGGVCMAPLTEDNQLIFVRQFRYPFSQVLLELPAGKIEPGEDPKIAGLREIREEVGVIASDVTSLGELYPTVAYCTEVIHLFLAQGLTYCDTCPDEDEFLSVEKIPLKTAFDMVISNQIKDAKTQIAILKINNIINKCNCKMKGLLL